MILKIILYFLIFFNHLACTYKQKLLVKKKHIGTYLIHNIQDIKIYNYIYLYMKIFLLDSILASAI